MKSDDVQEEGKTNPSSKEDTNSSSGMMRMMANSPSSASPPLPPPSAPFKLREDNRIDNNTINNNNNTNNNDFRKLSIYEMIISNHRDNNDSGLPESFLTNQRFYSYQNALHRPVSISVSSSSSSNSKNNKTGKNNNNNNNSDGNNNYNNNFSLDYLTRQSLPYPQPWYATAGPNEVAPDFSWLSNSCGGKAAIGVFGGGIMGLLMGVFLGAMSDATPPIQVIGGKDVPQAPLKEQVKVTMRATADKSLYWCRNFAFITGVFSGSECLVEKYRGTHDVWNSVASGCITGAAIQAKSGPQAAAMGCGGFAAFSLVIDTVMGNY